MMVRWSGVAAGAIIAPVIILFVTWIGFFNVGASTGHWKITEWFLELAMRSAVRWRVPDSLERIVGSGISWTLLQAIFVALPFSAIAPSIFASW